MSDELPVPPPLTLTGGCPRGYCPITDLRDRRCGAEPFRPVGCEVCGARGRLLPEDLADWAAQHPYRCAT